MVQALDNYLNGRTSGRIFIGQAGEGAYGYRLGYAQLGRLCSLPDHRRRREGVEKTGLLILSCARSIAPLNLSTPVPYGDRVSASGPLE